MFFHVQANERHGEVRGISITYEGSAKTELALVVSSIAQSYRAFPAAADHELRTGESSTLIRFRPRPGRGLTARVRRRNRKFAAACRAPQRRYSHPRRSQGRGRVRIQVAHEPAISVADTGISGSCRSRRGTLARHAVSAWSAKR